MSRRHGAALGILAVALVGGAVAWSVARSRGERTESGPSDARAAPEKPEVPLLQGDGAPQGPQGPTPAPKTPAVEPLAVAGVLHLAGGLPARGWRVRAVPVAESDGPASSWVPTDAAGRYRIEGLGSGSHRLVAKAGPLARELEVAASVVPTASPPADPPAVSVNLPPDFFARPPKPTEPGDRGRVRIVGHDGGAVARAAVEMFQDGRFAGYLDVADGEFVRASSEPWNTTYRATAPVVAGGRPLPYGPLVQSFADAGEGPVTVRLPPERVVEGRVLAPDGSGIPDSPVHAAREAALELPPESTAKTGPSGEFRLGNLGDARYRLTALVATSRMAGASWIPAGDWSVQPSAERTERIELRFREGVSATVRVLDPANAPVAEASVGAAKRGVTPQPYDIRQSLTDAEGRVQLKALDPDAEYVLSVRPPRGRGDLRAHRQEGWKPGDASIVLERGYVVSGNVRSDGGQPSRGLVRQKQADGTFRPVVGTGPDGAFLIPGLPDGPITLAASRGPADATGPEVTVAAGTTGVVLSLPPSAPR